MTFDNDFLQQDKVIGILQPSYLPWLGYFEQIHTSDVFVVYDDVQFEKGSWRNRNRIKTPQGAHWLTVPVLTKKKMTQPINAVCVNNNDGWAKKHIKTIEQYYSKAPFFGDYAPELFSLLEKNWTLLSELNMTLIRWFNDLFGITTPLVFSSELDIQGKSNERLISIIEHFEGNVFYEGSAGRAYIEEPLFEKSGIRVRYQDYGHPVYSQLHGDFVSHLSVLDLLLNHGPESFNILTLSR